MKTSAICRAECYASPGALCLGVHTAQSVIGYLAAWGSKGELGTCRRAYDYPTIVHVQYRFLEQIRGLLVQYDESEVLCLQCFQL